MAAAPIQNPKPWTAFEISLFTTSLPKLSKYLQLFFFSRNIEQIMVFTKVNLYLGQPKQIRKSLEISNTILKTNSPPLEIELGTKERTVKIGILCMFRSILDGNNRVELFGMGSNCPLCCCWFRMAYCWWWLVLVICLNGPFHAGLKNRFS